MDHKPGLLSRKWVRVLLYAVSTLLLACGVFLLVREHVLLPDPDFVEAKQSCEVFPGGVLENGQMEVIDRADAATWLENVSGSLRPAPGEEGNAIIAGHKSKDGVAGTFKVLWDAKAGDAVVIDYEDGTQGWFYIDSIDRYPYQEVPASVMSANAESPQLTLITCIGEWDSSGGTSSERLVAVCKPGLPA